MNKNASTPAERAACLSELGWQWGLVPQQRLGQLVSNLAQNNGPPRAGFIPVDPFYINDFTLLPGARHRIDCDHDGVPADQCAHCGNDPAESAYWNFDARRRGYAEWHGMPMSERDAFKAEYYRYGRAEQRAAQPPVTDSGPQSRWRVGRSLGRTLYRDEVCVGIVDTAEIAAELIRGVEARERKRGPRPENPYSCDAAVGTDAYTRWSTWQRASFDVEAWCDSGDSGEEARLRAELEDSETERKAMRKECNAYDKENDELEVQAMHLRGVVDKVTAERDAEKVRADRAEAESAEWEEAHDRVVTSSDKVAAELTQAKERVAELEGEVSKERGRAIRRCEQADDATERLCQFRAAQDGMNSHLSEVQDNLDALTGELAEANRLHAEAAEHVRRLGHELAEALEELRQERESNEREQALAPHDNDWEVKRAGAQEGATNGHQERTDQTVREHHQGARSGVQVPGQPRCSGGAFAAGTGATNPAGESDDRAAGAKAEAKGAEGSAARQPRVEPPSPAQSPDTHEDAGPPRVGDVVEVCGERENRVLRYDARRKIVWFANRYGDEPRYAQRKHVKIIRRAAPFASAIGHVAAALPTSEDDEAIVGAAMHAATKDLEVKPMRATAARDTGVSDATFRDLRHLLCAASIQQRGVDDGGELARQVLQILGLKLNQHSLGSVAVGEYRPLSPNFRPAGGRKEARLDESQKLAREAEATVPSGITLLAESPVEHKFQSAIYCEHANENPCRVCRCPADCACREHMCPLKPEETRGGP